MEGTKYVFNSSQLFVENLFHFHAYSYGEFSPSLQIQEYFKVLDKKNSEALILPNSSPLYNTGYNPSQ